MNHIINVADDLSECSLSVYLETDAPNEQWTLSDIRAEDGWGILAYFSTEDDAVEYARKNQGEIGNVTLKIVTGPGTNASAVADAHTHGDWRGNVRWYGSVDRVDSEGCGRVFVECEYPGDAKSIASQLDEDDNVNEYEYC